MAEQHLDDTADAPVTGTDRVKRGMAEMLKGGVIMDVVTADQAKIAEDAGAVAVMALERVPSDIRRDGGVARMSDPDLIDGIIAEVSIPVMAKARIGHFVEAQVLQSLGMHAKGGIAERSDRLVAILVMTGFAGLLDLPILRELTLWALALASLITVFQRMVIVYRQTVPAAGPDA